MIRTAFLAACAATLAAGPALAQKKDEASSRSRSSEKVVEVQRASSGDGKDEKKSYRRVERDGKVVEESGDKGLLGGRGRVGHDELLKPDELLKDVERDLDELLKKARANGARGGSSSSSSSSSRRIVIENGKVVVDEATKDGKKVKPGPLPKGLKDLPGREFDDLEKLLRDVGRNGGATSSHSRRVVVRNGETVVDEETVDGKPVRPGKRPAPGAKPGERAKPRGEALPKDVEDLLRKHDALPESVRKRLRDLEERERRPAPKIGPKVGPGQRPLPEVKPVKTRIG